MTTYADNADRAWRWSARLFLSLVSAPVCLFSYLAVANLVPALMLLQWSRVGLSIVGITAAVLIARAWIESNTGYPRLALIYGTCSAVLIAIWFVGGGFPHGAD